MTGYKIHSAVVAEHTLLPRRRLKQILGQCLKTTLHTSSDACDICVEEDKNDLHEFIIPFFFAGVEIINQKCCCLLNFRGKMLIQQLF